MTPLRALGAVAWTLASLTAGYALAATTDTPKRLHPGTHKVLVDQRVSGERNKVLMHGNLSKIQGLARVL